MHPDLTSQVFHVCLPSLTTSPSKKEENKSIFSCSYTHWSMTKFLVDRLPQEEEFFSACTYARSPQLRKSCEVAREKWSHLSLAYSTACVMGLSFPHSYHGWDCCMAVSEGHNSPKPMLQLLSPCFDWERQSASSTRGGVCSPRRGRTSSLASSASGSIPEHRQPNVLRRQSGP